MNNTKKAVLHRDNYKCHDCNLAKKVLTIHHIMELNKHPELKFKRSNLITLCQSCHKKRHAKICRYHKPRD
ncbi:MAG: HNH endonuclease [Nitrosopumilus sp.]|nr:HNH endonuclease [Nitrosopumilus sp.]